MSLLRDVFNPRKYTGNYQPLLMVFLLSAFSMAILVAMIVKTGNFGYYYLAWNLFLAWMPLFFAYLLYHRMHFPAKTIKTWKFWSMTFFWLIFFPNAPYLITDLIHINNRHNPATWGDAFMLFSFALSGLATGINSLFIMQLNFRKMLSPRLTSALIAGSIVLSGFGIYLGRVQRWNSWDIFVRPHELLADVLIQLQNPTAIYMTLSFSMLMGMVYLLLLSLVKTNSKS